MHKQITFILLLLLLSMSSLFSQNEQSQISSVFSNYLKALKEGDLDQQLSLTYPKLFEHVSIDTLRLYLKLVQQGDSLAPIHYCGDSILLIEPVQLIGDSKYSRVHYSLCNNINFSQMKDENGFEFALLMGIAKWQEDFGKENVQFNNHTYVLTITEKLEQFAINDNVTNGWKFLDVRIRKELLLTMLPEQIL